MRLVTRVWDLFKATLSMWKSPVRRPMTSVKHSPLYDCMWLIWSLRKEMKSKHCAEHRVYNSGTVIKYNNHKGEWCYNHFDEDITEKDTKPVWSEQPAIRRVPFITQCTHVYAPESSEEVAWHYIYCQYPDHHIYREYDVYKWKTARHTLPTLVLMGRTMAGSALFFSSKPHSVQWNQSKRLWSRRRAGTSV